MELQIVQKLSTRQPSRQMVLQEIAAKKGIVVHVQEPSYEDPERSNQRNKNQAVPQVVEIEEDFSGDSAQSYQDVEAAAQAAFESAAPAAAAAKAAMELSRGQPRGPGDRRQTKHGEETFDGKKSDKIGHARNDSSRMRIFLRTKQTMATLWRTSSGNRPEASRHRSEQRGF